MMISIVVPCFNEEEALPLFHKEITKVFLEQIEQDYELVLVDDGSSDGTLSVMRELAAVDSHVKYLSFSRNFGKEAAIFAGFTNVRGDYIAMMDADLQDPPALLPQMLKIIESDEYDSVATRRTTREGEPPVRSFFARMFYRIINKFSDADIVDGARDYRLMKRRMLDAIISMSEYNRFSKGIFGWVGFRTYWLAYANVERVVGQSKWNFWKLFKYAIDGIMDFSTAPLSLSSGLGILMTFFSFLMLAYIIVKRIVFGNPVAGWASTVSLIIFVGGMQLFCLGIMGQYIARIYKETQDRPHFIVAETNVEKATQIK